MRSLLVWATLFITCIPAYSDSGDEYSVIEKNHKKGLANKKGRMVIPAEYEDLGWSGGETQLLEDVIGFKKDDLWGILNTKNERVTEPLYTSLTKFNENWIVASKKLPYNSNIVYGVINAKGNAEIPFNYHLISVHKDVLVTSAFDKEKYVYGMLDDRAKVLIPMEYEQIEAISETLFQVMSNDRVAVFNHVGENLTDFSLDSVQVLEEGFILTFQNGKKGLIAKEGAFIEPPAYHDISLDEDGIKVQKIRKWKAYDEENKLLASYEYDDIVPKGRQIYKVRSGEAEALILSNDSVVTAFSNFEILEHFGDWISVRQNGKSGVLNFNGTMFLPAKYDSVRYVNNVFLVKYKKDGKRGWSLVNTKGDELTDQVYDEIDWLGDSYYKVKRDDFWGVIDRKGREVIFCKYDSIVEYIEGKLLVKFMGEDGILNTDGNWEILPQNKDIEVVDPMRYLIRSPYGSYVAYYPDTKDFSAEFFLFKHGKRYLEKTLDGKYGLLNEDGERIIKPLFDDISELQEDSIYIAKSEEGYSFITKSGQTTVSNDRRFQDIYQMSEAFIGVKIDDRWGFVDINGKLRIANQYDNIGKYNEGLAPVKILGRWGYIDKSEEIIIQPAYDTVYTFKGGICEVVKKEKFGLINAKGKVTLDCEYDRLFRLKTGGFLTLKDGKYGLASAEGRLLILPKFDQVTDLDNGFVIASRRGKFGLMSNKGVSIIPMIYEKLKYDPYNNIYLAAESEEWTELKVP